MQGGIFPIRVSEHAAVVAGIVDNGLGIPEHGALHVGKLVVQLVFRGHLVDVGIVDVGELHGALHVFADIERTL